MCAFISNTRLSQAVSGTFPNINTTVDNLDTYLASIPQACPKGPPPPTPGRVAVGLEVGKGPQGAPQPVLTPRLSPCSR